MTEIYNDFMVFELEDTGERKQLEITEKEFRKTNGNGILHPSQVAIIIKEDLRRIYIWKGYSSSVRKKFIASRVASELQQELMKLAGFHRCKVISVDQGEEPDDFLNAFGFQSQEVPEGGEDETIIINPQPLSLSKRNIEIKNLPNNQEKKTEAIESNSKSFVNKSFKQIKDEKQSRNILQKVLKYDVPHDYKRKNILTGHNFLYGEITKKANFFGEAIEEKEWAQISNLSEEIFELEGHKLRIHFNNELGMIEAVEILEAQSQTVEKKDEEKKEDYNKWTVKQLRAFCKNHDIKIPSGSRKADIVNLVEDFSQE